MERFSIKHQGIIAGIISCFDGMADSNSKRNPS
jgi:hypothetical protein